MADQTPGKRVGTLPRAEKVLNLAANATDTSIVIPAGEVWTLETVVLEVFSAASILRINDQRDGWNPPTTVPVPLFILHPSVDTTEPENRRFVGPLTLLTIADGDGFRVRLIFAREPA